MSVRYRTPRRPFFKPPRSPRRTPCQTYPMIGGSDGRLTRDIPDELTACRTRGIERLDLKTHNQDPVPTPELDALADQYIAAGQRRVEGRIARLKYLLRDAIEAFSEQNESDAELVRALFFGDSQDQVTKSAGELLDIARKEWGFDSEVRFRQVRHNAFNNFTPFLVRFAARRETGSGTAAFPAAEISGPQPRYDVPDPEVQTHVATTGYVDNGEHFITLLSQAVNVTIVGFTNETLAPMLKTALDRKRAAMLMPDGFWDSMRIVFLSADLINSVNGEPEDPESDEVLQRRRAAIHGRRTVDFFLRSLPVTRWAIYDSPYYPPFTGTLFEMSSGKRIVQLIVRRPQQGNSGQLYLELEDTRGHYFSQAFEEVVHGSVDSNKMVPVGFPVQPQRFRVSSARRRQDVLRDGSQATGWLALVLVITWRARDGQAEPLLQLRTKMNAIRELDRLTHLPDYITQNDSGRPVPEFGLQDEVPMAIARRRVEIEAGEGEPGDLDPLGTCEYLHPDKENLFFFIYGCPLPEGFQLWRQAEIYSVPVRELMVIREIQALSKAQEVCGSLPARRRARTAALEIAASNLILHGHADIAQALTTATRAADFSDVGAVLREREGRTRQNLARSDLAVETKGLSGLQYREFFSIVLPYYERVGVPGAASELTIVNHDDVKRTAVTRLTKLYHDEGLMEAIPYEL